MLDFAQDPDLMKKGNSYKYEIVELYYTALCKGSGFTVYKVI